VRKTIRVGLLGKAFLPERSGGEFPKSWGGCNSKGGAYKNGNYSEGRKGEAAPKRERGKRALFEPKKKESGLRDGGS